MQEQQVQQLPSAPPTGAYVSGLHLEGARYDCSTCVIILAPCETGRLHRLHASMHKHGAFLIVHKPCCCTCSSPKLVTLAGVLCCMCAIAKMRSLAHCALFSCRWVPEQGTLATPEKGRMIVPLPILHIQPQQVFEQGQSKATYQCPLYLTASRAGVLSSTGQSTNFVMHVHLPIPDHMQPADFVLQGVAATCSGDC